MRTSNDPSENFCIEVYQEDGIFESVESIILSNGWKYAYVLHNKDIGEDGKPIKPHYCIFLRKHNASTRSAIAKRLGISIRFVQRCDSWKAFAVYLIHGDKESKERGKYQYPIDDIKGNMVEDIVRIIQGSHGKKSVSDKEVIRIVDMIESSAYVRMSDVMRWANKEGLISTLQRFSSLIKQVIKEHNDDLSANRQIDKIWVDYSNPVAAENKRYSAEMYIASKVGNKERIKEINEQHFVNMDKIYEMLGKGVDK